MRLLAAAGSAVALLLAAPGPASADIIFDPSDADDLAATLAEATEQQNVCYGWNVTVQDVSMTETSVGSNFGADQPVTSGTCDATVEFTASITYTAESSESEDSASYDAISTPSGVSRADLDVLGLDWDELTGENPDVIIGKAVAALPLLAADKGLGNAIQAAPATGTEPADAQLTDSPGSDWWRGNGGALLWGLAIMAAGGLFAWWVLRSNRRVRKARRGWQESQEEGEPQLVVPDYPDYYVPEPPAQQPGQAPVLTPTTAPEPTRPAPEPEPAPPAPKTASPEPPEPAESGSATSATTSSAGQAESAESTAAEDAASTEDSPAPPSKKDVVSPEQKDKE